MSYLVLARRWRPQRFADLVGQDVVVRTLQNSLKNNQMAHAYLLCGIRGTGKTTIARLMAMVINCADVQQGEPCGTCPACTSIATGSNLDVLEIDAASHTKVEEMREVLEGVRYPPASLGWKVYIIDEAHMLSNSAFNALLKTLEEPPAHVLFLLATTEPDKLPVTVRSRCQRFDLRRLGADEISRYLAQVLGEEKVAFEAEALHAIAHAADGSVRDALSLTERVLAYGGDALTTEHVRHALGLVGPDMLRDISDAVLRGEALAAIEALRAAGNAGHTPRSVLLGLSELWHDLACMKVDASLIEHEPGEAARAWLKARLDCWDTQGLDLRYQVLIQGLRELGTADERQGADMLLIRLCALGSISPAHRLPDAEDKPRKQPAEAAGEPAAAPAIPARPAHEKPASHPEPRPAPAAVQTPVENPAPKQGAAPADSDEANPEPAPETRFGNWEETVEAYGKVRAGVAAMLDHVLCLGFGDKVRLALDEHQQRAIVAAERMAFAEWLGREVHWEPKSDQQGESLSAQRSRQAAARQQQLEQSAAADPHVQALIGAFDATIEAVRPPGAAGDGDINTEENT